VCAAQGDVHPPRIRAFASPHGGKQATHSSMSRAFSRAISSWFAADTLGGGGAWGGAAASATGVGLHLLQMSIGMPSCLKKAGSRRFNTAKLVFISDVRPT